MVESIRRDDYVRLGRDVSLSLSKLAPEARSVIENDVVLSSLVKDEVIRGSDFGAFYDRLAELDRVDAQDGDLSMDRAKEMYRAANGAPGKYSEFKNDFAINQRGSMGIFASPMNAKSAKAKESSFLRPPENPDVFLKANADITKIKTDPQASITLPKEGAEKPADAPKRIAQGEAALQRADAERKVGQFSAAAESEREAAQAFADAGEGDRAAEAAARSAESYQKAGMKAEAASMFISAGKAAEAAGDFEKAGDAFAKAGRLYRALDRKGDAATAFMAAGDRYRDEAIYRQGGLRQDNVAAARNWDRSTQAYLEGGAKFVTDKDGKESLRFGGNTIADLDYVAARIGAGVPPLSGKGAVELAKSEHFEAIGDRLAANGDRQGAAKYYQRAKSEREASGAKDRRADDRLTMKIASADSALDQSKVENYTKTLRQQTAAGDWEKVESTLQALHSDIKADPKSFPRKETAKLAEQLEATGKAAAKASEWSIWEILAAIFACLTVVGLAIMLPLALTSTDNDRVRDLSPEVQRDLQAKTALDPESPDAHVELQAAQKFEREPLELPQGLELAFDGEYYGLADDTPAIKAAQAYKRAYDAENIDPALRETMDRRAGAVLAAEMERVEASTELSPLQKAAYFQKVAEYLPAPQKDRALQISAENYAKMASTAEDPAAAAAGAKRALAIADQIGVDAPLRAELEKAEKNLGILAAKAKGEDKPKVLLEQARVNAKLAASTDDPKLKKALYTKAAKLAEEAAAAAPQISGVRAQALQNAGNYRGILGESSAATTLHLKAAAAYQALGDAVANSKDKKMSAAEKYAAASDSYAAAATEYRKVGKDAEADAMDAKSFEYSNRATRAQLDAMAPPALSGDPKEKVTGEQIAQLDEARLGKPSKTTADYRAGSKKFAELKARATTPAAAAYYDAASKRYAALAEMSARLPSDAAPLTNPPGAQNMKDFAKATKDNFVARYQASNEGKMPDDALVASHVANRLSAVYNAFYVHQNERGGPIDRKNGAIDVGAGTDGRVMVDCVTCSLDLNTAMSAAGFKLKSVGAARDKQFGDGHMMLEVQSEKGEPLGFFNNLSYKAYRSTVNPDGELDAGFREVIGNDPPFTKFKNDPETDPARSTGVPAAK